MGHLNGSNRAAFARTGNPNTAMLPDWPAFDLDSRSTMIFNNTCRQVNDPYSEERQAIASALAKRIPNGFLSLMFLVSEVPSLPSLPGKR